MAVQDKGDCPSHTSSSWAFAAHLHTCAYPQLASASRSIHAACLTVPVLRSPPAGPAAQAARGARGGRARPGHAARRPGLGALRARAPAGRQRPAQGGGRHVQVGPGTKAGMGVGVMLGYETLHSWPNLFSMVVARWRVRPQQLFWSQHRPPSTPLLTPSLHHAEVLSFNNPLPAPFNPPSTCTS